MAQSLGGCGLEGQRSLDLDRYVLDLDRYAFFGAKTDAFEGSCIWPKALAGVGWRPLDRYAFFGAKTDVL